MKRGTPRHPKVYDLAERLGCDRPTALGYLELLWHFTAEMAPQGDIGRFSDKRIEAALDWVGRGKPTGKLIESLTNSKWCDADEKYRLLIHDWKDHIDEGTRKKLVRASLCIHEPTPKVSGQCLDIVRQMSPTMADNGGLPRPLPEPLPEPAPQTPTEFPKPPRYEDTASERDIAIRETSERMYALHPKKKNLPLVVPALTDAVARAPDWRTALAAIEECHAAWCTHAQWHRESGKFVSKLPEWIADQGYTQWPPGHARNQPQQKLNIYELPTKPPEEPDDPRTNPV